MKIKLRNTVYRAEVGTTVGRASLAKFIADVIARKDASCYELPYKPNEHDDCYWTLDHGNDWKVKFDLEDNSIEIIHRYKNENATKGLTLWVAYLLDAEEVVD